MIVYNYGRVYIICLRITVRNNYIYIIGALMGASAASVICLG